MKTVETTIEEDLMALVDRAARRLKMTRSAYTWPALRDSLKRLSTRQRESRHRQGYATHLVRAGEFDVWTDGQTWPE